MSEQKRDDYKFPINIPKVVTFTAKTQPIKQGVGQYGDWYLFEAVIDGREEKFFANDFFYKDLIKKVNSSNAVTIIRKEEINPSTGKTFFKHVVLETNTLPNDKRKEFGNNLIKETIKIEEDKKWEEIGLKKTRCALLAAFITGGVKFITPSLLSEVDKGVNYVIYGDLRGVEDGSGTLTQYEMENSTRGNFEGLNDNLPKGCNVYRRNSTNYD